MNPNGVRPGQIWQDNDKRMRPYSVYSRMFTVMTVDLIKQVATVRNAASDRLTTIKLRRFRQNSTGYRLVAQAIE